MRPLSIYQVDAFTNECFKGNPAGVCILDEEIEEKYMQLIAQEMNLSETAFVWPADEGTVRDADIFIIRWFTPLSEVPLCGHATLAATKILFSEFGNRNSSITYKTKSGMLAAKKCSERIALDFPIDEPLNVIPSKDILKALGIENYENTVIGKKTGKLVIHLSEEKQIYEVKPNFQELLEIKLDMNIKGIGITSRGNKNYDFISRYFNPWAGVNEDSVTGSVHTLLASYWGQILKKKEMRAYQASQRGGEIVLKILEHGRVQLIGDAVITLKGEMSF